MLGLTEPPKGDLLGPVGPFFGPPTHTQWLNILKMVSTYLTEKNEPKMSSIAEMKAEIPCWASRSLPRVTLWAFGAPQGPPMVVSH